MTTEQAKSHKADSRRHLEIACFDAKSVLLADQSGASRIEFCTDRASGGITPLRTEILDILPLLQNPAHIMIRPRGGDFVYSDAEFEQMKHDVRAIKAAPGPGRLGGFVFGILDSDGRVDVARNFQLVELARPLSCTFHRAFDETRDLGEAMEDVISCGFETVLTSGGAADAVSGVDILEDLVAKANERIVVMPGGGVRSSNIELLITKTKAGWYHSSAFAGDEISMEEVALLCKLLKSAR